MIKNVRLQIEGLSCPDCSKKIEQAILSQKGIESAKIMFTTGIAKVKFDDEIIKLDNIKKVIENFGYNVTE